MKSNKILLKEQSNGDLMYVYRRKGSNPNREKYPMLKCPLCKKNLHTVFDASVKMMRFFLMWKTKDIDACRETMYTNAQGVIIPSEFTI